MDFQEILEAVLQNWETQNPLPFYSRKTASSKTVLPLPWPEVVRLSQHDETAEQIFLCHLPRPMTCEEMPRFGSPHAHSFLWLLLP